MPRYLPLAPRLDLHNHVLGLFFDGHFQYWHDVPTPDTYRYPPILAMLMVPNVTAHPVCGKLLFCLADLGVGLLIWTLIEHGSKHPHTTAGGSPCYWPAVCTSLWLFNPLTVAISTRGNAEAVVALTVLATLRLLQLQWVAAAGLVYGLAVHLKLYPVIYALPTLVNLGQAQWPSGGSAIGLFGIRLCRAQLVFALGAACSLAVATSLGYVAYGWPFLWQTYLFHFVRADHRHNFSPYFYAVYLTADPTAAGVGSTVHIAARLLGIAALVPQAAMVVYIGTRFAHDLPFAWLLQTMVFVMLNKVPSPPLLPLLPPLRCACLSFRV